MNAGKYDRALTWLQRSVSKDNTTGQDKQTFTANGTLWGNLKELSASKQLAFGMLNSQATMAIRLRQWPAINPEDRLRDKRFNDLIVIDGISHDHEANELVIYAHKLSEVE